MCFLCVFNTKLVSYSLMKRATNKIIVKFYTNHSSDVVSSEFSGASSVEGASVDSSADEASVLSASINPSIASGNSSSSVNTSSNLETEEGAEPMPQAQVNATARTNGVTAVRNTQDVWKEKYRLTMSNLLSAAIGSGKDVDFGQIDKYVRMILEAEYDGDKAPF